MLSGTSFVVRRKRSEFVSGSTAGGASAGPSTGAGPSTRPASLVSAYLVSALRTQLVKCVQMYRTSGLYCFQFHRCPRTK